MQTAIPHASATSDFIVIGAGPVGLAVSLLLSKRGRTVTLYEKATEVPRSSENTYPIGVNQRSMHTLSLIDPALADGIRKSGFMIDAWSINNKGREMARLESGCVVGTTRGELACLLYEYAVKNCSHNMRLVFGQKLADMDLEARTLTFESHDGVQTVVDASHSRVLAADGVWSGARKVLKEKLPGFQEDLLPWNVTFRVLFCGDGAETTLDPALHYIFAPKGIYAALIPGGRWVNSLTIRDDDPDAEMLRSTEATDENMARLREYISINAPPVGKMLSEDALRQFFSHRMFSGAVVKVSKMNVGEWLLLVGDAAHAVVPPTGEGTNSGLEDVSELFVALDKAGESAWFETYNESRLPDLHALNELAKFLTEGLTAPKSESLARVLARIALGTGKLLHIVGPGYEDYTFGKFSELRTPYREVVALWKRQTEPLLKTCRGIASWFA